MGHCFGVTDVYSCGSGGTAARLVIDLSNIMAPSRFSSTMCVQHSCNSRWHGVAVMYPKFCSSGWHRRRGWAIQCLLVLYRSPASCFSPSVRCVIDGASTLLVVHIVHDDWSGCAVAAALFCSLPSSGMFLRPRPAFRRPRSPRPPGRGLREHLEGCPARLELSWGISP